jgi:hypothetical protein
MRERQLGQFEYRVSEIFCLGAKTQRDIWRKIQQVFATIAIYFHQAKYVYTYYLNNTHPYACPANFTNNTERVALKWRNYSSTDGSKMKKEKEQHYNY